MSFDYSGLNSKLRTYYGSLSDQASLDALTGYSALNTASITATATVVAEQAGAVTTQAVTLSGILRSILLFLTGFVSFVDSQGAFNPEGPESESILGLIALMGPWGNKGFCSGTLTIRHGERRFSSQAAVNRLKTMLGSKDASGSTVPLQQLEPADLLGPQVALLALYLKGGKSMKDALGIPCLVASTILEEVADEDIESFKSTLGNTITVASAVRRNLVQRQNIIRRGFVAALALLEVDPPDLPQFVKDLRAQDLGLP